MSFEVVKWVRDLRGLTGVQKSVAYAMAERANNDGACWPAVPRIAAESGNSVRTVQRVIKDLQKLGILTIENRSFRGRNTSNLYVLAVDRLTPPPCHSDTTKRQGDTTPGVTVTPHRTISMKPSLEQNMLTGDGPSLFDTAFQNQNLQGEIQETVQENIREGFYKALAEPKTAKQKEPTQLIAQQKPQQKPKLIPSLIPSPNPVLDKLPAEDRDRIKRAMYKADTAMFLQGGNEDARYESAKAEAWRLIEAMSATQLIAQGA